MIVLITGSPGSGKTSVAFDIAGALAQSGQWKNGLVEIEQPAQTFITGVEAPVLGGVSIGCDMAEQGLMLGGMNEVFSRWLSQVRTAKAHGIFEAWDYDATPEIQSVADVWLHIGAFNYEQRFVSVVKNRNGRPGMQYRFRVRARGMIDWGEERYADAPEHSKEVA